MKLKNLIEFIKVKIRARMMCHHYQLSPRGQCCLQYLLDKYINRTKPETYNEAYEIAIRNRIASWRRQKKLQLTFVELTASDFDKIDEDTLLFLSAHTSFITLLLCVPPKERGQYYAMIEDEKIREATKSIILRYA